MYSSVRMLLGFLFTQRNKKVKNVVVLYFREQRLEKHEVLKLAVALPFHRKDENLARRWRTGK